MAKIGERRDVDASEKKSDEKLERKSVLMFYKKNPGTVATTTTTTQNCHSILCAI
jgi:hypothetical protein